MNSEGIVIALHQTFLSIRSDHSKVLARFFEYFLAKNIVLYELSCLYLFALLHFCTFALLRQSGWPRFKTALQWEVMPLLETGESLYFLKFKHNDCFFILGLKY
ncbi:hypothetical protein WB44_00335 [Synechococcus sp. WH 8020]|nr:hypothetical protein WB44_00335 [Synechococcus sp. WH 8020]